MATGKKKLERRYLEHVARELGAIVDSYFGGNQTKAAKALGMSQPHLSHLIAAEGRGPGLHVLIQLRSYTNRSIDSLLGLAPLPSDELTERLRMAVDTEIARIARDTKQGAALVRANSIEEAQARRTLPQAPRHRKAAK